MEEKKDYPLSTWESVIGNHVEPMGGDKTIYVSPSINIPQPNILGYDLVHNEHVKGVLVTSDSGDPLANVDLLVEDILSEIEYRQKQSERITSFGFSLKEPNGELYYMTMDGKKHLLK